MALPISLDDYMPPRKKATGFTFFTTPQYPSDDEDDDLLPGLSPVPHPKPFNLIGQRHSQFNNNNPADNVRQRRNVYMASIPSPAAPAPPHRSEHESNWNTEPPIDFYELYLFADPSYQHTMDVMDSEVVPRKRTKSVSDSGLSMTNNEANISMFKGSPSSELDTRY